MLSWPPASTIALSPVADLLRGRVATARRPEPQIWLMPKRGALLSGMPAAIAACRAGFWPLRGGEHLAEDHLVHLAPAAARRVRARLRIATRAEQVRRHRLPKAPLKLPTGVRAADTIDDLVHSGPPPPDAGGRCVAPCSPVMPCLRDEANRRLIVRRMGVRWRRAGRAASPATVAIAPPPRPARPPCRHGRCAGSCSAAAPGINRRQAPPRFPAAPPGPAPAPPRSSARAARRGRPAAPAIRHSPRMQGCCAPYQPARHSRPPPGRPAAPPSDSANLPAPRTSGRGRHRCGRDRAKALVFAPRSHVRILQGGEHRPASASTGMRAGGGRRPVPARPRRCPAGRAASRSAAWKSHGVASSSQAPEPDPAGAGLPPATASRPAHAIAGEHERARPPPATGAVPAARRHRR